MPLTPHPPYNSPPLPSTGYWSVDAKAETAMGGCWKKGPGLELFTAMKQKLGKVRC